MVPKQENLVGAVENATPRTEFRGLWIFWSLFFPDHLGILIPIGMEIFGVNHARECHFSCFFSSSVVNC